MPKNDKVTLIQRIVRFLFLIMCSPFLKKICGAQHLPRKGAFILAANHISHLDWIFLLAHLTRPVERNIHFLATSKYYNNPIFKFFVEFTQGIWVNSKEEARALIIALRYLQNGKIIGVFPEGGRSRDSKIKPGHVGVAAFALFAKVPVVPVGLLDMHKILPVGGWFLRPGRCQIEIGAPLEFSSYYKDFDQAVNERDQDKITKIQEEVTRKIMQEIARLSAQDYPY